MPPWHLCCPQVPASCVSLCWWLPSLAQTSLQKSIAPNSCHVKMEYGPGTLTSFPVSGPRNLHLNTVTKHGILGPGLVCSTSSVLSYSFSFHFHWARFICSENSTRFTVACSAKTYNKEAWGSDKVSRFKHPRAWVSSMNLLSRLMFVTTETEPRFENLSRGHINKVNFLSLCTEETLGIATRTA